MKMKLILLLLLVISDMQAQETDSLWNAFTQEVSIIASRENRDARFMGSPSKIERVANMIMDSTSEKCALKHLQQKLCRHPFPNVRDFAGQVLHRVARNSNNQSVRQRAIGYLFCCYLVPDEALSGLLLNDFDDRLKKKIMMQLRRQFAEENVSFFAESYAIFQMRDRMVSVEAHLPMVNAVSLMIVDKIQSHQDTITHEEARNLVFNSFVSEFKQRITPSDRVLMIAGQLNMQEAIPYLIEFANEGRIYAVYALATMRVGDFEYRAANDFKIDTERDDMRIAQIINSQKVWYAYRYRLKSQEYNNRNCPVAYLTMNSLGHTLKGFPYIQHEFERWVPYIDGVQQPPPPPPPLRCIVLEIQEVIRNYCFTGITPHSRIPINPEHIGHVLRWMEINKGNFQVQQKIDRTY